MTTFDDREKAFEKKFAHDEELRFRVESRRDKMLAQWAAPLLGLSGDGVDAYVRAVHRTELLDKGHDDVFHKLRSDFDENGVAISDREIRSRMHDLMAKAALEIETEARA